MRFIPTAALQQGMIVGENLYNRVDEILLSRGTVLTEEFINSIRKLKYNGIYVDDEISMDVEICSMISEKARVKTLKGITDVFVDVSQNSSKLRSSVSEVKQQVEGMVEEIYRNPNIMISVADMKMFDFYTYYHAVNVSVLSIAVGVELGMKREDLCQLGNAALLHDIGKVFLPKEILNKTGRLTKEEFEVIKTHTQAGYDHVKEGYGITKDSLRGILDHHEKYSGGGYPNNLSGEAISLFGRIIEVADVYDALISDRPYRKALLPTDALEYIMALNVHDFDPKVLDVFCKKLAPFPVGTCVALTNGEIGIVIENREEISMRPKLRIFKKDGEMLAKAYVRDLADLDSLSLIITEIVS